MNLGIPTQDEVQGLPWGTGSGSRPCWVYWGAGRVLWQDPEFLGTCGRSYLPWLEILPGSFSCPSQALQNLQHRAQSRVLRRAHPLPPQRVYLDLNLAVPA